MVINSTHGYSQAASGRSDSVASSQQYGIGIDPLCVLSFARNNVRDVYNLFKALSFREQVNVEANKNGIKVIADDIGIQAVAYLKENMFTNYFLRDEEDLEFRVNLNVLCECLNLFGSSSSTTLKMTYEGYGEPLKVVLEDGGIVTDCEIKTMEPEQTEELVFDKEQRQSYIIMKAEGLHDALSELEHANNSIELSVSTNPPHIRITCKGDIGDIYTDLPKNSEYIEKFECRHPHKYNYRLPLIKRTLKALHLAKKVCLRTDTQGALSMQFMIELEDGETVFIEFYILPDTDVYDEEDDE